MSLRRPSRRTSSEEEGQRRHFFDFTYERLSAIRHGYPFLLIAITWAVYFQSLFLDFTFDDRWVVLENPLIRQGNFTALWNLEADLFLLRQVRTLTYMIDYVLFGLSPAGYHLHNLAWHTLCAVLVFVLIKKLTQQTTVAFFGALIFAIHPIHVEAVSNITNRKESLALGFLLIAFLCYFRFLEGRSLGRWGWLCAGGLAWGLGLFSKQVTIVFPLLLVAYELLLVPREQRFLTNRIPLLLSVMVLVSLPLILYAIYEMDITNFQSSKNTEPYSHDTTVKGYRGELTYLALVATSARTFWTYIQLWVWPAGLCPDHIVNLSTSFLDFTVLLSWAGLIAFILIAVQVIPRWPVIAFGMLWFLIGFVPISNWVPISYLLADRYMYFPSVGLCIVLAASSQAFYSWLSTTRSPQAGRMATVLAAAVTIGYASTTLASIPHWRTQETVFTYMLRCHPQSGRANNGLGNLYLDQGLYEKARDHFSLAIAERFIDAYNNRGNAFYHLGDHESALNDYNQVIALIPQWDKPYSNRGILFLSQGRYDRAIEDFTNALERSSHKSQALNLRGLAYEKLDNWAKAQEDYEQAISSDPANAEAYFNLGRVHLHQDDLDAAILSYQKAKELGWEQAEEVLNVLRKKGYM